MPDCRVPTSNFQLQTSNLRSAAITPKRILVIRLDRLGDVVLSSPVLQVLRENFPHAFIAMMVRASCQGVVEGNPYINEVIVYDKEGKGRRLLNTIRFARGLTRYEFDTAIVLHPSNRSHWIPYLAKIPTRIGYSRKSDWLLTHRLEHHKQEGLKHEALYTLELLAPLGIKPSKAPEPFVPLSSQASLRIDALLAQRGVQLAQRLVAIHPSASCVSKRWMPDRFAKLADRLTVEQSLKVCVVAGKDDVSHAKAMLEAVHQPVIDFSGQISVSELAALLRRCCLLISNDSGPVHVAAAVGTPVIDIFGRNQRGLSPLRWGPLGEGHIIVHKEVGCVTCLAHNCDIGFLCLESVSVDEIYQAAVSILQRPVNHRE